MITKSPVNIDDIPEFERWFYDTWGDDTKEVVESTVRSHTISYRQNPKQTDGPVDEN